MDIATADIAILSIVTISGLISLVRGFVKEAMSLVIDQQLVDRLVAAIAKTVEQQIG